MAIVGFLLPHWKANNLKNYKKFIVILAFSVVAYACAATDGVVPPKVNLVNIVPAQSSGVFEQRFLVELRISNPNEFDIPLNGLSFEMDVNGDYFATGLSNTDVVVPRFGSAVVSAETTASSIQLFRQILNAVRTGTVDYSIKGKALVGQLSRRSIPFDLDGELNLVPEPGGSNRIAPTDPAQSF